MIRSLKFAVFAVPLLVFGSLALVACGGDDNDNGGTSPTSRPAATSAPAGANPTSPAGGTGNNVTMGDFNYNPQRLNARVGQPLQLTISNGGQQPHTFTITGVVDTGTMSAGQSRNVNFTPSQAGTLVFFCTVHGQATMSGQVIVAGASGSLPSSSDDATLSVTSWQAGFWSGGAHN